MDESTALVLAAVISAATVALTFLGTELLRWRREVRTARVEALTALVVALDKVPRHLASRYSVLPWRRDAPPDLEIASAGIHLYAVLPRRHWNVVKWVGWRLDAMSRAREFDRLAIGADVSAIATAYISQPRRARNYVARFRREVEAWYEDGHLDERRQALGR